MTEILHSTSLHTNDNIFKSMVIKIMRSLASLGMTGILGIIGNEAARFEQIQPEGKISAKRAASFPYIP